MQTNGFHRSIHGNAELQDKWKLEYTFEILPLCWTTGLCCFWCFIFVAFIEGRKKYYKWDIFNSPVFVFCTASGTGLAGSVFFLGEWRSLLKVWDFLTEAAMSNSMLRLKCQREKQSNCPVLHLAIFFKKKKKSNSLSQRKWLSSLNMSWCSFMKTFISELPVWLFHSVFKCIHKRLLMAQSETD